MIKIGQNEETEDEMLSMMAELGICDPFVDYIVDIGSEGTIKDVIVTQVPSDRTAALYSEALRRSTDYRANLLYGKFPWQDAIPHLTFDEFIAGKLVPE